MKKIDWFMIFSGVIVGAAALVLTALGNPENMGFCIACFLRDTAGAMGLHSAQAVQYVRPEIIGLVLGSFVLSILTGEFRAKSGSAPIVRFLLGAFVMVGALAFLGCPLRMLLRLGGGDGNALVGLLGFTGGIFLGTRFLRRGFTLGRSSPASYVEGALLPAAMVGLLSLVLMAPSLFRFSEAGPGSKHAPFLIALAVAAVVGAICQRSRLCLAGGLRDTMLFGDVHLLWGFGGVLATVVLGNLILGKFSPGFAGQPIAHAAHIWNFVGMALCGWGSVLLGGCPLRQLILAGSGNADSAVTVLGMMAGAALCHNFGLAGNADSIDEAGEVVTGGLSLAGKTAVLVGLAAVLVISIVYSKQEAAK